MTKAKRFISLFLWALSFGAGAVAAPAPSALKLQVNGRPVDLPNAALLQGGRAWVLANSQILSPLMVEYEPLFDGAALKAQTYRDGRISWIESQFTGEETFRFDGALYLQAVKLCGRFEKICDFQQEGRSFSIQNDGAENKYPTVFLDGKPVRFLYGPMQIGDGLFVALGDDFSEALGAQWQVAAEGSRLAAAVRVGGRNFIFRQDGRAVETDGGSGIRLETAPFLFQNRFYVPLGAFAQSGLFQIEREDFGSAFRLTSAQGPQTAPPVREEPEPERAMFDARNETKETLEGNRYAVVTGADAPAAEAEPEAKESKKAKKSGVPAKKWDNKNPRGGKAKAASKAWRMPEASPERDLFAQPDSRLQDGHSIGAQTRMLNRVIDYNAAPLFARMDLVGKSASYAYGDGKWFEALLGIHDFDREADTPGQTLEDSVSGNSIQFKLGYRDSGDVGNGVEYTGASIAWRRLDLVNPLPAVNAGFLTLGFKAYGSNLDLGVAHFNASGYKTETGLYAKWQKPLFKRFRLTADYSEKDFQKYFLKTAMGERLDTVGRFDFSRMDDGALTVGLQYLPSRSAAVEIQWYDLEDFSALQGGLTYRR